MGADIHMKTYVWSKIENKYIDAYSLCDNLDIMMREFLTGSFPELVGDRHYDLFNLFGYHRGNSFKELDCLNYGIPDFVKETTFGKILESGYFGFCWCGINELKKELVEYKDYDTDPEKFLDHDSDIYLDWKEDPNSNQMKAFISEILEESEYLNKEIDKILEKLSFYDKIRIKDDYSYESQLGELIDVDKTIFLFWFDN